MVADTPPVSPFSLFFPLSASWNVGAMGGAPVIVLCHGDQNPSLPKSGRGLDLGPQGCKKQEGDTSLNYLFTFTRE